MNGRHPQGWVPGGQLCLISSPPSAPRGERLRRRGKPEGGPRRRSSSLAGHSTTAPCLNLERNVCPTLSFFLQIITFKKEYIWRTKTCTQCTVGSLSGLRRRRRDSAGTSDCSRDLCRHHPSPARGMEASSWEGRAGDASRPVVVSTPTCPPCPVGNEQKQLSLVASLRVSAGAA